MAAEFVFTAISKDRPGLVEKIASVIADYNGNWVDSSMARLGGEFAGIVRVTVPLKNFNPLKKALQDLEQDDIIINVRLGADREKKEGPRLHLHLTGNDHPGIVRDVAGVLASLGASIEQMETALFPGSMTGEAMFSADAEILLPENVSIDLVREKLEQIAHDIMVEIELSLAED